MSNASDAPSVVYIVDDDMGICRSLQMLLSSVGLDVRTFGKPSEFLSQCDASRPGCIVLDLRLPEMSGLDVMGQLAAGHINLPVIGLTAHDSVVAAVDIMKAGAVDFLTKPVSEQLLLDAVHRAIRRDRRARSARKWHGEIVSRAKRLTPREREVMELVVAGFANKQVAAELGCSAKTVEVHRARVMEKMRAENLPTLVKLAMELEPREGERGDV